MVLPGIQALFGFQLVAVFNQPFWERLSFGEQIAHLTALAASMALAIGMVLTPASYHRIVEPESVSQKFLRLASYFMSAGMACLLGGIVIDVYLIARLIVRVVFVAAVSSREVICLILAGTLVCLALIPAAASPKDVNQQRGEYVCYFSRPWEWCARHDRARFSFRPLAGRGMVFSTAPP